MIRKIKKTVLVLFLFSLFASSLLALVSERSGRRSSELKLATSGINLSFAGESYYLTPVNLDFSSAPPVIYPFAKIRPFSLVGYFKEFVKDGMKFSDIDKNWLYLSAKRISIMQYSGSKFEILNNYKDIGQFDDWEKKNMPKYWEFWHYSKVDTWEGSLGELFYLMTEKIAEISQAKITGYQRIEETVKIAGVIKQHKTWVNMVVDNISRTVEEKKYLRRISDDIFNKVFEEIYKVIPEYEKGVFRYSVGQIIENRNFGMYNVWVDTSWLGSKETSSLSVEINENNSPPKELTFEAGNRYGMNVGKIRIREGMDDLVLVLRVPKLAEAMEKPPRIWLKKVAYLPGGEPKITLEKTGRNSYKVLLENVSLEKERMIFGSRGFGWKIIGKKYLGSNMFEAVFYNQTEKILMSICIFSFLLLLLIILPNLRKKIIPEKFSLRKTIYFFKKIITGLFGVILDLNKRCSLIFICLFIFGMFIAGNRSDLYTLLIFAFWMLTSFSWNLDSRFSYLAALFLMLACPPLLFFKNEYIAESLSIVAFFFLLTGVTKQQAENTNPALDKMSWKEIGTAYLNNFFGIIVLGIIAVIYQIIINELYLYEKHFGQGYLREFMTNLPLKLLLIWFLCFVVLRLVFKVFDRFVGCKLEIKEKAHYEKIAFVILLLIFQAGASMLFFQKARKTVLIKPYILKVAPDIAGMGEEAIIYGHSFVDLPSETRGWVFLDGVEQTIKEWKNEKIIFLVTDEYSNTGLLNISNMYGGKLVKSNSVKFTFIDLIESEEPE